MCKQFAAEGLAAVKKKLGLSDDECGTITYSRVRDGSTRPGTHADNRLDYIFAAPGFGIYGGQMIGQDGVHMGVRVKLAGFERIFDNNVLNVSRTAWENGYEIIDPISFAPKTIGFAASIGVGRITIN